MSFGLVGSIVNTVTGGASSKGVKVNGTVILMKKNVLDFNDITANLLDSVQDLLGQSVSFQLVSSTVGDPNNGNRGVVGDPAYLEQSILGSLLPKVVAGESEFSVTFTWDVETQGIPGAVIVKNKHAAQFLLKSLTLDDFPGKGRIHFPCNSWVYNVSCYSYDRVFFANNTYMPDQTPGPLKPYREEELTHLRGDDVSRQLQEWDRVYNYAYYNDLGDPDLGNSRPILGGSEEYPYPRRGRTGRPATLTDPKSESRTIPLIQDFYVPRDERFGHLKASDFLGYSIKAVVQSLLPTLQFVFNTTPNEFDSYKDILKFYEGGLPLPNIPLLNNLANAIPFEMVKAVVTTNNGDRLLKFPLPRVLQEDQSAWVTDEEFAREMLAGVNPILISRLREFPPTSALDPSKYGDQTSTITAAHIESNLDGLTVDQALSSNKLYILDHHDAMLPYLSRINSTDNKTYATRTVLYLKDDDTLKPVAIELSLPHPEGEERGPVSTVYTPSDVGIEKAVWELAKAYVRVNDYGVHELISHWLNTHACVEPFVLSTNRHLSVVHPIYKLLSPHYRDTMNINALARQALINSNGIIELTTFPGKYSLEISSAVYKSWNFTEQALPADLLKRGLAVEDSSSPNKVSLLIKDYPYAVDGLAIWSAIRTWVEEYCGIYYPSDAAVQADVELQAWWKEVREVGHGDKKNEPWWPTMQTLSGLTQTCTTIIWMSSALHAAVNFGQYAFDGYMPNRPTVTRRLMPVAGSAEYQELQANPEKATLRTLSNQIQTLLSMSTLEILSTHASDEVYLGQRESEWTTDQKAVDAFQRFGDTLRGIEKKILELNQDPSLKNRNGLVKVPYTLLFPSSDGGITEKGIPNSISI